MIGSKETVVIQLEPSTLELRYYDDGRQGRYRCWRLPLHVARDIAQWWGENGSELVPGRDASSEQRFGSVLVRFLSTTQIYARGCDRLGRPDITGYQLPHDAVAYLKDWISGRPINMAVA